MCIGTLLDSNTILIDECPPVRQQRSRTQRFKHTPMMLVASPRAAEPIIDIANTYWRHQYWQVYNHHQAMQDIQEAVYTLMVVRSVPHQPASILSMMPNELMFEIFARLPLPTLQCYRMCCMCASNVAQHADKQLD
jgi:hypothetical protein